MPKRPLLVCLDLDETLYYRGEHGSVTHREADCLLPGDLAPHLFLRPYAKDLLSLLSGDDRYRFGFYTASCGRGTNAAVGYLESLAGGPSAFFFDRARTTTQFQTSRELYSSHRSLQVKDLKKVRRRTGFELADILVIDDKPVYPRQYGNVLYVSEYHRPTVQQDAKDDVLRQLTDWLSEYHHNQSIRETLPLRPRLISPSG